MRRDAVELERLDVRERTGPRQVGDLRDRGMRSHVEEHPISRQHSRTTIIQEHLKRLRSHEATRPHDQLGATGRVALPVQGDQPINHVALALSHAGHVDLGGARPHSELFRMLH